MNREEKERLSLEDVTIHNLPAGLDDFDENTYFPINNSQINTLLGRVLTQLETMNMPDKAEKANKVIFKQMIWRWFDEVMENSVTSSDGCIAPIRLSYDEDSAKFTSYNAVPLKHKPSITK